MTIELEEKSAGGPQETQDPGAKTDLEHPPRREEEKRKSGPTLSFRKIGGMAQRSQNRKG